MSIKRRRGALRKVAAVLAVLAVALVAGFGVAPRAAWADDLTAPVHNKSVSDTPDENGQYTLTLDVVGQSQTSSESRPVDVIFVLDTSNSMNRRIDSESEETNYWNPSRLSYATDAIKTMTNGLLGSSSNARVSLITFDGSEDSYEKGHWEGWPGHQHWVEAGWSGDSYDDADTVQGWTNSSWSMSWQLDRVSTNNYGGGTNWEAGLYEAQQLLGEGDVRPDADTYVVFVSDGNAGYYYNDDGYTQGDGNVASGTINQDAYDQAVALAQNLDAKILSVGVGPQNNVNYLKNFADAVNGPYYSGASEQDLNSAVSSILQTIKNSQTYCSVSIVDTLSDYVTLPSDAISNNVVTGAKITVTDANGTDVTASIPEANSWKLVREDDGSLRLDFGDGYELGNGYTYSVSFPVVPTQRAYDYTYGMGDQDGSTADFDSVQLPTNKSAQVEYSIIKDENGNKTTIEQDPVDYNIPTIAVPMSQITITKVWNGEGATPDSVAVQLQRDGADLGDPISLQKASDGTWLSVTVYVPAGPSGHTYSISEVDPGEGWTLDGITLDTGEKTNAVKLTGLTAQSATFTVTNVPESFALWVYKTDADSTVLHNAKFDLYKAGENDAYVKSDANRIGSGEIGTSDDHAVFDGLQPGTYYLVETYVPAGYQLREAPYKIVVSSDGIQFASSVDGETSPATKVDGQDRTYKVSFENEKAVTEIPSTGGIGDVPLYAAGVVAVAGSVMAARKIKSN